MSIGLGEQRPCLLAGPLGTERIGGRCGSSVPPCGSGERAGAPRRAGSALERCSRLQDGEQRREVAAKGGTGRRMLREPRPRRTRAGQPRSADRSCAGRRGRLRAGRRRPRRETAVRSSVSLIPTEPQISISVAIHNRPPRGSATSPYTVMMKPFARRWPRADRRSGVARFRTPFCGEPDPSKAPHLPMPLPVNLAEIRHWAERKPDFQRAKPSNRTG